MTDQNQRLAPGFGFLEECQHMSLRHHVERGSRLVGDEDAWIECKSRRDESSLTLTAG